MAKPGVKAFSELAALSSKQHGLMTHEQVMAAGLNRMALSRLVRSGEWQRLRPRVFRRFAKSQTDEQALMAVCLSMGEGVVLSHRSAAKVLGLALDQGDLEVTTSAPQRPMKGVIVHRSGVLEEVDVKVVRSFPITAGARTIIDLASCLNEQELAIAVEEAWRKRIAVPEAVSRRLSELRVQGRQIGALDAIIADCSSRSRPLESALEVVVWRLIKGKDLPTPIPGRLRLSGARAGDRMRRLGDPRRSRRVRERSFAHATARCAGLARDDGHLEAGDRGTTQVPFAPSTGPDHPQQLEAVTNVSQKTQTGTLSESL